MAATGGNPVASWTGLLRDGVSRCEHVVPGLPRGWASRVRQEIESGDIDDLLSAAEKISSKLNPQSGEYRRWLRETIGALRVTDPSVIEALQALRVPIATTNYDGLIEDVTGLAAVTWRHGSEVERVLRGDDPGVVHLHGHWRESESVVLGIRSYDAVLGDAHAQTMLRALRATRTFLFVGFGAGLADPNFGALLRWSRGVFAGSDYRHFRLALAEDVARFQAEHQPEERVFVLPYGTTRTDLASFLRSLVPGAPATRPATSHAPPPAIATAPMSAPRAAAAGVITPPARRPLRVVFGYSRRDDEYRDRLHVHLTPLRRQGLIDTWHDALMDPGVNVRAAVNDRFDAADIVLLLISASFLASDFSYGDVMQRVLARHNAGETRVVPILLSPCDWQGSPYGELQALPRNARPITSWTDHDEAFLDVVRSIRLLVEELAAKLTMVTSTSTVPQATPERAYQLFDVFMKSGMPTVTFVATKRFQDLKLALAQPGRGVVIEGPSGIGKTTALRQAIKQLREEGHLVAGGSAPEILSARKQADVARLATIEQWHRGTVAIDDFHRLPRELLQRMADYLKSLADEDAADRKLVVVGIPKTGQALIDLAFDLANRIEVITFNRVDSALVQKMIVQGERALNVRFDRRAEIILASDGSLNIAQFLCFYLCQAESVFTTRSKTATVRCDIGDAIRNVLTALSPKFREPMRRFARMAGPQDRVCVRLLEELRRSDEGSVSLLMLKDTAPALATPLRRFEEEQWMQTLQASYPELEMFLFYDPSMHRITIDDPQLAFYLRSVHLEEIAREAGVLKQQGGSRIFISYVLSDLRWLERLQVHLGPLTKRGLVLDIWEESRLTRHAGAYSELRQVIEAAAMSIVLVSADYLVSEFSGNPDRGGIDVLLGVAAENGASVRPVVLKPCLLTGSGLDRFPVLNPDAALSEMGESAVESTLVRLAEEIARLL
ncbi:hypothetical protein BE17_33675 [Sorangium cellulosum]|uniref:TIR domain-containing protein n=1 Tax=Sorangium cellulosum TaxID=56 RepID=A0A150R5P3_SORCE|nr:hypothetical protein BE17_33675 [Sorangium cellulosum]